MPESRKSRFYSYLKSINLERKIGRKFLTGTREIVVVKDTDGTILYVNPNWEELTGISKKKAVGKSDHDLHSSEWAARMQEIEQHIMLEREIKDWDMTLDSVQGPRYLRVRGVPLFDTSNNIEYIYISASEIPRYSNNETSLYKKMISNIGDVIAIIDKNGINRYKSSNMESLFGWKPEELIGKNALDNIHPDDFDRAKEFLSRLANGPQTVGTIECRYRHKDGIYRWIEFKARNLIQDPEIQGILGNYHEITSRKQAEDSLRESEARFKALHNASFGGITIHDKGLILDCNKGLSDITGYSVDELIGMDGLLLLAESSRDLVMKNILDGYEKPYEAIGLRKNGEEYPIRLEARNIPYKGKMVRVVEFRDLTESKRGEEEKRKLQDQLIQAQKMESIGRLAGGVAHDFNNLLSVIMGYSELAMMKVREDMPVYSYLKGILEASIRSEEIISQLLAFARRQTVVPAVLDLNETIEKMYKMLQRLIGESIILKWEPGESLWSVMIDPSQVNQILANLCVNSRDAIPDVGQITIRTTNTIIEEDELQKKHDIIPGDYVLFSVTDSGVGMTDEVLENLFEPFYTTKAQNKGTGLGLATVYGIVKQNKGFIDVLSTPGSGATFNVYFPAHLKAETSQSDGTEKEEKKLPSGNETILLVEDEPEILSMTTIILEKLSYKVISAGKPEDALDMISRYKGRVDLLLTDVIMPGMNGKDLADKLKSSFPGIKVIYTSGYTADIIGHHGVLDKGVQFLQKPFSIQQIAEKIRTVLS